MTNATPNEPQSASKLEVQGCAVERNAALAEVKRLRGIVAAVDSPGMARTVAKTSWDRGEADYWNYETDRRQFDPTITELDGDDADRGHEWLGVVTEILTDLRTALDEASR